jgi:hypothetical protein
MLGKKLLLLMVVLLYGCSGQPCQTKASCQNDPKCECWCSQKCGFRKKDATDNPIYIKNDPDGKFCYCKKWDYKNYKNNCKLHKNVKEPKGAK